MHDDRRHLAAEPEGCLMLLKYEKSGEGRDVRGGQERSVRAGCSLKRTAAPLRGLTDGLTLFGGLTGIKANISVTERAPLRQKRVERKEQTAHVTET